jgi:hypothetical protein
MEVGVVPKDNGWSSAKTSDLQEAPPIQHITTKLLCSIKLNKGIYGKQTNSTLFSVLYSSEQVNVNMLK